MIAVIFTDNEGGKYSKLYQEYESNRFDFGIELTRDELKDFKVDLSHHPDIVYKCLFRIEITNWIKIVEVSNDKGIILMSDRLPDTLLEYMPVAEQKTTEKQKRKKRSDNESPEKTEDFKRRLNGLMTANEAAKALDVTKKSIYNFLKAGRLKGVRAGRDWLFSEQNLNDFLEFEANRALEKMNKSKNDKSNNDPDQW